MYHLTTRVIANCAYTTEIVLLFLLYILIFSNSSEIETKYVVIGLCVDSLVVLGFMVHQFRNKYIVYVGVLILNVIISLMNPLLVLILAFTTDSPHTTMYDTFIVFAMMSLIQLAILEGIIIVFKWMTAIAVIFHQIN